MKKPLLSIVTISLDNKEGLELTLKGIFDQNWQDFELIVIDGGSNDGSKEFLQLNNSNIHYWVSEPDQGVYYAMNKGITKATGEYILFLNSGDTLCDIDVLTKTSVHLSGDKDIYYGDVFLTDKNEKKLLELPKELSFSFFYFSTITHQAAFIKRSLFDQFFYYNEGYKLVSDWEFFIYAICKENCSYQHLDIPVCNYDVNGLTSQEGNIQLMIKERKEVLENYFPLFLRDYKELFKARQKLKSPRIKSFSTLEQKAFGRKINNLIFRLFTGQ